MSADAISGECSSVAREVFDETEEFLRRGIQDYKDKNLQEAAEALDHVLKARSQHFGEFSMECAKAHYYYGVSLFELSKLNSDVFGNGPVAQQIISKDGEGPSDANAQQAEPTTNDENVDNATVSSSEDDQVLAWDALEVAKHSYERGGVEKHRGELADVHCALADMNIEQGNAEAAFEEYKMALDLLSESENVDEQRLSEVHFRFSIGVELEGRYEEAKEHTLKSIDFLEKKIASLKAGAKADSEETLAQISDLEGVIESLRERVTDLNASIENQEEVRKMVKTMFMQGLNNPGKGVAAKPSSLEPSTDIGVVGRGKERITLKPIDKSVTKDDKDAQDLKAMLPEKRPGEEPENSNLKPNPKKAKLLPTKVDE